MLYNLWKSFWPMNHSCIYMINSLYTLECDNVTDKWKMECFSNLWCFLLQIQFILGTWWKELIPYMKVWKKERLLCLKKKKKLILRCNYLASQSSMPWAWRKTIKYQPYFSLHQPTKDWLKRLIWQDYHKHSCTCPNFTGYWLKIPMRKLILCSDFWQAVVFSLVI